MAKPDSLSEFAPIIRFPNARSKTLLWVSLLNTVLTRRIGILRPTT
jgi:hypothetical protein